MDGAQAAAAPRRAPLAHATVEVGEVVAVERLGSLVEVTAVLPHLAATARPGQFAQLRCSRTTIPLLRRPFSVAWVEGDRCSFVLTAVGTGTRLLAALQPGDPIDVLGPLGRGFTLDVTGPVVCVSGGVGCAPFPLLLRALRAAGVDDITVLNGASTRATLYPAKRFQRGDARIVVREATEDGTVGQRGRVTALLDERALAATLFACGPNPMLAAVARVRAERAGAALAEASLEAPMGCGFGTCLGCALPVRGASSERAWALCCTDGPVMRLHEVDWDAVAQLPAADVA